MEQVDSIHDITQHNESHIHDREKFHEHCTHSINRLNHTDNMYNDINHKKRRRVMNENLYRYADAIEYNEGVRSLINSMIDIDDII